MAAAAILKAAATICNRSKREAPDHGLHYLQPGAVSLVRVTVIRYVTMSRIQRVYNTMEDRCVAVPWDSTCDFS